MTASLPPLADLLDLLPDAVCVVDAEGRFLLVSSGFERILGYPRDEVLGLRTFDLVHPDDREATIEAASQVMAGAIQRHFRNRYVHKAGHSVDIQWSARWHPEYGVRIAIGREVTELRQAERELEHRASHDPLTGLPNRRRMQVELGAQLSRAARDGSGLAVLYVDLDGFKAANDRAGHDAGDRLLCEVAARLQQALRQRDLVARVGGDEFVVLLPGCEGLPAARAVADALRACMERPFSLPDGPINVDASIGIACHPGDGASADALLAHADRAMFEAKRQRATQAAPAAPRLATVPR
ncbi:sensor domain-containing diguanylate cyclase [Lysobacter sp. A3-1-A15]|uniref:sensor domain-containing diguanylate cyclase n=1 Tax=Novilysobacter viscosus TaxID=3098602 RepID=UPI002ED9104B